jgi:hypothetical protein
MALARTLESIQAPDGLVLATVDEAGPWHAIRLLRTAMKSLRADGWSPEGVFLVAMDRDGRMLPAVDPSVTLFVFGYRLSPVTA